ncbi:hypothetical protein Pcinc_032871 [Petrolisthes cinctipes]|uniref:Uncharacterized protein n=1 Tax=Petrolisthes cinctipes TaxID=88211 RepID=A0AAE1K0J2_PETCI|nr:hypothetical protein Pcinc_032871 [Petrolisthes cinctipes]
MMMTNKRKSRKKQRRRGKRRENDNDDEEEKETEKKRTDYRTTNFCIICKFGYYRDNSAYLDGRRERAQWPVSTADVRGRSGQDR